MSEKQQKQRARNWLLHALPDPEWIPEAWDIVLHVATDTRALVLTKPSAPDEVFEIKDGQATRPVTCTILLGEETLMGVDVSLLRGL